MHPDDSPPGLLRTFVDFDVLIVGAASGEFKGGCVVKVAVIDEGDAGECFVAIAADVAIVAAGLQQRGTSILAVRPDYPVTVDGHPAFVGAIRLANGSVIGAGSNEEAVARTLH